MRACLNATHLTQRTCGASGGSKAGKGLHQPRSMLLQVLEIVQLLLVERGLEVHDLIMVCPPKHVSIRDVT